jgi:hypothetical protein
MSNTDVEVKCKLSTAIPAQTQGDIRTKGYRNGRFKVVEWPAYCLGMVWGLYRDSSAPDHS